MKDTNYISKAIEHAGLRPIADACDVSYQAVRKWEKRGHLPLTEWAGMTSYAIDIELATNGHVTEVDLLSMRPKRKAAP